MSFTAPPEQLVRVNFGHKLLSDYRSTLVPGMYDEIRELGQSLAGARVLHLSATAFGGGVAEIMYTLMPLMADVGLEPEWGIIHGTDEFYDVTKLLHNSLQGDDATLSDAQRETYLRYQQINARLFSPDDYDIVIVHDPQPLGVIQHHRDSWAKWAWRCHIDMSTPNPDTLEFIRPLFAGYGGAFFHRAEYVPDGWSGPAPEIVAPAIDPLAPKNMALAHRDAAYIVQQFGIDVSRPLLLQVSRFDPWKDPTGVIDAWRRVREEFPGVQLALVGSLALDDPEGMQFLQSTLEYAQGEPDVFILTNLDNVGSVEVNAFQVVADVVIQKSTREGFGLTVSEALWKARPVVAGNVGGIRSQITNGETGWLVDSVDEAAACTLSALRDPDRAGEMARAGKEHVRREFLTPRYLRDHLKLYRTLLDS